MKSTMLVAVAALIAGTAATAHAKDAIPTYSAAQNAASLKALLTEWDQAGFNPPSKPAQYRVYGRNGYVTSGPGYNTLVSEIRSAVNDARRGGDRAEAADIARAKSLLAASKPAGSRGDEGEIYLSSEGR